VAEIAQAMTVPAALAELREVSLTLIPGVQSTLGVRPAANVSFPTRVEEMPTLITTTRVDLLMLVFGKSTLETGVPALVEKPHVIPPSTCNAPLMSTIGEDKHGNCGPHVVDVDVAVPTNYGEFLIGPCRINDGLF